MLALRRTRARPLCAPSLRYHALRSTLLPGDSHRSQPFNASYRNPNATCNTRKFSTEILSNAHAGIQDFLSHPITNMSEGIVSLHAMTGIPYWALLPCLSSAYAAAYLVPYKGTNRHWQRLKILHHAWSLKLYKHDIWADSGKPIPSAAVWQLFKHRHRNALGWRIAGAVGQIIHFIMGSMAVRNLLGVSTYLPGGLNERGSMMSNPMDPALVQEGMLWFPNLSVADPAFILPAITIALYLQAVLPRTMAEWKVLLDPRIKSIPIRVQRATLLVPFVFGALYSTQPAALWLSWLSYAATSRIVSSERNQRPSMAALDQAAGHGKRNEEWAEWWIEGSPGREETAETNPGAVLRRQKAATTSQAKTKRYP